MPERDDLDRLIDSELARYAEPRAGLEQRILSRVTAEGSTRFRLFRQWRPRVLAGATALTIMLLVISLPRISHRESSLSNAQSTTPDSRPLRSATNALPEAPIKVRGAQERAVEPLNSKPKLTAVPKFARHPKLDVFPSPQPLSGQEQALVAIATANSDSARENLWAGQRQLEAPVQISAIEIPPLTSPDEGKK